MHEYFVLVRQQATMMSRLCTGTEATYSVVYHKVTELHRHGDEVDSTVQLVLLKILLQVNIFCPGE